MSQPTIPPIAKQIKQEAARLMENLWRSQTRRYKLKMRNDFDFHNRAFGQRGDLDRGARRKIAGKIFGVNFVHAREVGEVREEDGALHDVGESEFLIVENRTAPAPFGSLLVRSHSERLLGRFRMADVSTHEPQHSRCLINAVPESAAASDFVLPLLQIHTDHPAGPERALEGVLPAVTMARVRGDALPRGSRIAWCCGADLLPSPDRFVGGEAEVPTARCWRW